MLKHIFEFTPVILAVIVIIVLSVRLGDKRHTTRRRLEKCLLFFHIITAFLLIIAQLSWYTAAVINGRLEDTWIANNVWTSFNTMAMIVSILYGVSIRPRQK